MSTTEPCPADQSAPVSSTRSVLAEAALAAGIPAEDVRAFVSATRYRLVASDLGLVHAGG